MEALLRSMLPICLLLHLLILDGSNVGYLVKVWLLCYVSLTKETACYVSLTKETVPRLFFKLTSSGIVRLVSPFI